MLWPADAQLASRDRGLPQLTTLLDADALRSAIQSCLPHVRLRSATPTYVRYKPGTNCLVAFELIAAGMDHPIKGYAKVFRPGETAKIDKVAIAKIKISTLLGSPLHVLPEAGLIVHLFPYDANLRSLQALGSADELRRRLRKLLPERPDLWEGDVRALAYKPERRFVGRLTAPDGAAAATLRFCGRDAFDRTDRAARELRPATLLRVARRIGCSDRRSIVALEWIPGRTLLEAITDPRFDLTEIDRVGRALVELHAQRQADLPQRCGPQEKLGVEMAARALAWLCPELAQRAHALATQITACVTASACSEAPAATHGDFYVKQVVLRDDGGVGFIDLDEAALGDPAADLGNFAAHLMRYGLIGRVAKERCAPATEALLRGYGAAGGVASESRVALHTAAGLLRLAPHPFRDRDAQWPLTTEAIVTLAEQTLSDAGLQSAEPRNPLPPRSDNRVGHAAAGPTSDPPDAGRDPAMPFLRDALDCTTVQDALDALDAADNGNCGGALSRQWRIVEARVVRHKPGRRCLIEYELEPATGGAAGRQTMIGKVRAKGADRHTHSLMHALRARGFDDHSRECVSVPQPLGIVPELHMWLQRKVPAAPVTPLLATRAGAGLAARIADAVVMLHEADLSPQRQHTMADELRILRERLPLIIEQHPHWVARLRELFSLCAAVADSAPPPPSTCGIHRDFYPHQVLLEPQSTRLWLVDFDLFCEGDPALDAGNFLAHLTEQSLRELGDSDALADCEGAFARQFVARRVEEDPTIAERVAAYAALTLARHVWISTRIAARRPFTAALLDLAETRCLDYLGARLARPLCGVFPARTNEP